MNLYYITDLGYSCKTSGCNSVPPNFMNLGCALANADETAPASSGRRKEVDYQDALDRIPNLYKIDKNYKFDVGQFYRGDSHYLCWEGVERYRTLVPDTKEPYWLEGPDEFQEELSNRWLGLEYSPSSGGFESSMVKREESADDLKGVEKEAF
ncbi:hypothetical protein TWF173_010436 [Orbilia oligospora]|nr:hypothetical protein TWF173_010436 [Orbilia oligospora]